MELRGSADRREAVIKRIDLIGRNGSKIRRGPVGLATHRRRNPHGTQHQGLPASVYTQVYTGVENSGLLGPHASKRSQSETALAKRICPPLSTWDLLRPQPPKLFANETLYQLSYTPKVDLSRNPASASAANGRTGNTMRSQKQGASRLKRSLGTDNLQLHGC
jgi:hypothetical protein